MSLVTALRRRWYASIIVAVLVSSLLGATAYAQATTSLSGQIVDGTAPVAGANVSLYGNNLTRVTVSDAGGYFTFDALGIGRYSLIANKGTRKTSQTIYVGSAPVSVRVDIATHEIAHVVVISGPANRAPATTNVAITSEQLTRSPSGGSIPEVLVQLPTAARGPQGQIHLNGQHADINYVVDGVSIPQSLSRQLGTELDPRTIAYAEVVEGAFPAQFGERFGAVVNLGTKAVSLQQAITSELGGGSYALFHGNSTYGGKIGNGSYFLSTSFARDGRALDPPVQAAIHDAGSTAAQFARLSFPGRGLDNLNLDLSHSYQTFQIPPDTAHGLPASTDDNETQDDVFASLIYRHAIGSKGAFTFGPSFKRSRIRDFNDPTSDLSVADPTCATIPANCAFSIASDRTASDYQFQADYALRSERHEVRAGGLYRISAISKLYDIVLQANNFIQPQPYLFTDNAPNIGHSEEAYIQDSWRMGDLWTLDYGLRADGFGLVSSDFHVGYAQLSPRVKVTRAFSQRASAYAYYGRLFSPFSLENISASNAQFLNPASSTSFDLKPSRESLYELGGHLPLGSLDVALRLVHGVITDAIDDGQVGATNIHQNINFSQGRYDAQSIAVQRNVGGGRTYLNVTHSRAVEKGCGSSLLIDCSQFPDDWINDDHAQRWSAAGGFATNSATGWLSFAAEFGSGLTSGACPPEVGTGCKVPPHLTFDVEKGFLIGRSSLAVSVRNILNDRYAITLDSALAGTHYARPRSIELRARFGGEGER